MELLARKNMFKILFNGIIKLQRMCLAHKGCGWLSVVNVMLQFVCSMLSRIA